MPRDVTKFLRRYALACPTNTSTRVSRTKSYQPPLRHRLTHANWAKHHILIAHSPPCKLTKKYIIATISFREKNCYRQKHLLYSAFQDGRVPIFHHCAHRPPPRLLPRHTHVQLVVYGLKPHIPFCRMDNNRCILFASAIGTRCSLRPATITVHHTQPYLSYLRHWRA